MRLARGGIVLAAAATLTALALLGPAAAAPQEKQKLTGSGGDEYLLRADQVVYDLNKSVVTAEGHVEIDSGDRVLLAERVVYDQKSDTVKAIGHVSLMAPNGDVAFADEVTLSDKLRDGALSGFAALIGQNGRLAAASATRKDGTQTIANRAVYTPCKICKERGDRTPLWQVRSYRVVYDEVHHKIRFEDAVLEMFGVPVLYAPFFTQADPTVKHETGLLAPDLGSSSTLGSFVRLPFYISFSDSQDATLAPLITTQSGEVMEGEYRNRWMNGGMWLQPTVAYNPNGGLFHNQSEWYSSVFGSGRIPVTGDWVAGYDVQLTSNDTYLKRYDISIEDRLVSDLFLQDINERSRFLMSGFYFQGLRASDINNQIPFVLPIIDYSYIPVQGLFGGDFKFQFNTASIYRDFGPDSQRVTALALWKRPFVTPDGQLLTFTAQLRGDVYRVQNDDPSAIDSLGNPMPLQTNYISRGLPLVAVDWRWPFVSGGGPGHTAFIIEPIAQATFAPYGGNPSGIPNEDSTDFELDETDIFSPTRMPGFDLWEPGPRGSVGLRTEALFPTGSVEFLVGESFRPRALKIFTPDSGINESRSDLVGRLTIKFPPHFSLTHRIDLDQASGSVRRNEIYVTGTFGRSSVVLNYLRLDQKALVYGLNPRQEVDGEATLNVWENWALFAGARRDLETDQMIDSEYGLGYDDECLGISLSYRRKFTRDRDVPPSTAFILRFNLKTGDQTDKPISLFPRHIFSTP